MALKICKECGSEVSSTGRCPKCGKDQRNFFIKHKFLTFILILIILGVIGNMSLKNNIVDNTVKTSTGNKQEEKKYINVGEAIQAKDWEIKLTETKFNQRIDPPEQPMFYTYYQVKDTDNTYLCIILEAKNLSELSLGSDNVATVSVKYNDKYNYSSFSTIEDSNTGFTYTSITNIKPLTSKKIYYLAEMPKNIANETDTPVEIEIKVGNNKYYYKLR